MAADPAQRRQFKRVVLKLSGEALREDGSRDNISPPIVENIARQVKDAYQAGVEVALVVGVGNFWRGITASNRGIEQEGTFQLHPAGIAWGDPFQQA